MTLTFIHKVSKEHTTIKIGELNTSNAINAISTNKSINGQQ